MTTEFKRYNKYCVFKWDDANKYLTTHDLMAIDNVLTKIRNARFRDGKVDHKYIVVNQEMPYTEQVWQLIQEHWEETHK